MFPYKLNDKYLKLSCSTRAISASSETSDTSGRDICPKFYVAHAITYTNSLPPFLLPSRLFSEVISSQPLSWLLFSLFVIFLYMK